MTEVEGIEYCLTHGGVMTEGTDYHEGDGGLGCEYPYIENDEPCVGTALFYERPPVVVGHRCECACHRLGSDRIAADCRCGIKLQSGGVIDRGTALVQGVIYPQVSTTEET